MNKFGRFAMEAWKTLAPTAYAAIEDPNQHFSMLGQEAEEAWAAFVDKMTWAEPPLEGLAEIGRLNMIRLQADELIHAQWCTPDSALIEPDPWEVAKEAEWQAQQAEEAAWKRRFDWEEEGLDPDREEALYQRGLEDEAAWPEDMPADIRERIEGLGLLPGQFMSDMPPETIWRWMEIIADWRSRSAPGIPAE